MTTELRIYVEGGGEGGQSKRMLRVAFGEFMSQLRTDARDRRIRFKIVTCGSRNSSFDGFREACRSHPDAFNILLGDSEGPGSAGLGLRERERVVRDGAAGAATSRAERYTGRNFRG